MVGAKDEVNPYVDGICVPVYCILQPATLESDVSLFLEAIDVLYTLT